MPGDLPSRDEEQSNCCEKAKLEHVIKTERRAVLVVNTMSRRGWRFYAQAKRLLGQKGVSLDAVYPVRDPARLHEIISGSPQKTENKAR